MNLQYLKDHICSVCHVAIMEPHPEEQFKNLGYIKCPVCGFTKLIKKELTEVNKIIYGTRK